jgi:hypothetical protein
MANSPVTIAFNGYIELGINESLSKPRPNWTLFPPYSGSAWKSTRVQIRVRIFVRFHVRFAYKTNRDLILHPDSITTICLPISRKMYPSFICCTPLAPNRTQNRKANRTKNRTCRRPHTHNKKEAMFIVAQNKLIVHVSNARRSGFEWIYGDSDCVAGE